MIFVQASAAALGVVAAGLFVFSCGSYARRSDAIALKAFVAAVAVAANATFMGVLASG